MSFGEFTWATAGSARYSRKINSVQSHMKAGMWKCSGTILCNMCQTLSDLVGIGERRVGKPQITQEMISKVEERKKVEEYQQRRRNEQPHKTEERIEASHRQR